MKKKIVKISLFMFIGLFMFTGGVVAATLTADDIIFKSTHEEWQVDNAEDALNDLYGLYESEVSVSNAELLWTNPNPNSNFNAQTINVNIAEYEVLIVGAKQSANSTGIEYSYVLKNGVKRIHNGCQTRDLSLTDTSIYFGLGWNGNDSNMNYVCIPTHVYGLKKNVGISE